MKRRLFVWSALLVVALLISACTGSTAPPPTAAELPTDPPADTQAPPTETVEPTEAEVAAVMPSPTAETLPTDPPPTDIPATESPVEMVAHANEPAPPNEFRSDSGAFVGATGNPQLVEFFTYW